MEFRFKRFGGVNWILNRGQWCAAPIKLDQNYRQIQPNRILVVIGCTENVDQVGPSETSATQSKKHNPTNPQTGRMGRAPAGNEANRIGSQERTPITSAPRTSQGEMLLKLGCGWKQLDFLCATVHEYRVPKGSQTERGHHTLQRMR